MSAITKVYNNKEIRGDIRCAKTFSIPLDRLYEEEGFNIRQHTEENIELMAKAWLGDEQLPPVVVETQPSGTFKLIEGHRRRLGALRANEIRPGTVTHIEAKETTAHTEGEQLIYMAKTTHGVPLKSWEMSVIAGRLNDMGCTVEEIGEAINRGLSNVKHHLAVAALPEPVLDLIKQECIQDSLALEIYRKQGEQAVIDCVNGVKGRKVKRDDTQLWTPKTGKRAVEILSKTDVEYSNGKCSITLEPGEYEELLSAINKLKMESK